MRADLSRNAVTAVAALCASAATGCIADPVYKLSIRVEVPPTVQNQLSSYPVQLLLADDEHVGCAKRIAILCGSGDRSVVAEQTLIGVCGMEKEYFAWLAPYHPPVDGPLICGPLESPELHCYEPPRVLVRKRPADYSRQRVKSDPPYAHATAFVGRRGRDASDCGREEGLRLILTGQGAP